MESEAQVTETQTQETTPAELTAEQIAAEEEAKRQAAEAEQREQEETEKKPWFKKRFDEITRQKYEQQQRAEEAERKSAALEERMQRLEKSQQQQTPPPQDGRPRYEDYEAKFYDPEQAREAYHEALTDWKIDQREKKAQQQQQQEQEQQKRDAAAKTFEDNRIATIAAGKAAYEDWEQTVYSIPIPIMTRQLAEATFALNNPAEAQYYLGKNLQEAERISKLSPYAMAAELGKIEAKLMTNETKDTKAPPPLQTVKGGQAADTSIPDPDKDPEGYIEARNRGAI